MEYEKGKSKGKTPVLFKKRKKLKQTIGKEFNS